jgi:pyruvate/2-oxoglutarate dehydrogenase complex dihydrolipoamide dehydrogenase (E3) component
MKKLGLEYIQGVQHDKVIKNGEGEGFTVVMKNGDKYSAEKILLAMGRPHNTIGMGLENTNI